MWHKENKVKLQSEKPDLTPAELTKYAMGKYKTIFSSGTDAISIKRKIGDGATDQSGIAKLAKFNFNK